jgi:DNA-binding NarL/FixJ family response regulator
LLADVEVHPLLHAGAAAYVCKGAGATAMLEALHSIVHRFDVVASSITALAEEVGPRGI